MGAPYIARAPKKVLVRIPRNEGYTTVPSGMATLRLIPSPLDKPQETENTQTESRGPASPLDRPQQLTTGVPTVYSRSHQTVPSGTVASGPVQLGRAPGAASEAERFVALQGRGLVGVGPRGRAGSGVYHNERSSSPAVAAAAGQHHQHGPAPSAGGAAGTTSTAPRATPLHYQGHFTAHAAAGGRCHQLGTATAATHTGATRQQQQPPPFTDFIAGQVWRALMMASQQQRQQQLQQQQAMASGGAPAAGRGPVVGGKRTRDVAAAASLPAAATQDQHTAADADEPSRKVSRVSKGGLQDAPQHLPQAAAVIYTTPAAQQPHTGLHITLPSPPSPPTSPPSSPQQQVYTTRFHTSIPTPPTTPPSLQHPCSQTLDDTTQLAHQESSKLLLSQSQQPMVPLSPPALSLPIMFPPVFPQSMKLSQSQAHQFPVGSSRGSSSSSSNSSGPVAGAGAVSGSGGGRGREGVQGAPPHQQASQLTVVAGVSPRPPTHHQHPLAALLQPTHGGLHIPVSSAAAHGVEGSAIAMSPYLAAAATAPPTPLMMRMVDTSRSGHHHHHHQDVRTHAAPGLYRGLPLYTSNTSTSNNSATNDKTHYPVSDNTPRSSSSSKAGAGLHAHALAPTAGASSPHQDQAANCT